MMIQALKISTPTQPPPISSSPNLRVKFQVEIGVIGEDFDALNKIGEGPVEVPLGPPSGGPIDVCLDLLGIDEQGHVIVGDCPIEVPLGPPSGGPIDVC